MSMNPRKGTVTIPGRSLEAQQRLRSDEHESSEGDCDEIRSQDNELLHFGQMSMNPRKGTVTESTCGNICRHAAGQMSMNPRKGTVTIFSSPR